MRGPAAAISESTSKLQSGGRSVTTRRRAPAMAIAAAYESYRGSNTTTSSPGSAAQDRRGDRLGRPEVTCTSSTDSP